MYSILKNLINVKYYKTKEIATNKINVCFAMNIIEQEQYTELVTLTNSKYTDEVDEVDE